jgi:hypothetical protein
MVEFTFDGNTTLVDECQSWIENHAIHRHPHLLNISANQSYTKVWLTIEANSESELLNIVDRIPIIDLYEYHYYALSISTSTLNFSGSSLYPNQ